MSSNLHRFLGFAALAALPLAACGDDDDSGGGAAPEGALVISALDSLAFAPESLTALAGAIDVFLVNDGSQIHTFVVEGYEDELKLTVGDSDEGTIELEAGEYTFYCDVAGHRGGGMVGTLTVE